MTRRPLLIVALLATALVATSCELLGDDTVTAALDDVQSQVGVDFRDPVSVGKAAVATDTIGNKEAEDGLDVVKGYQRADHEQKGDSFIREDPPRLRDARNEYMQALNWTYEPTLDLPFFGPTKRTVDPGYAEQQRDKRAGLHARIAITYELEARERSREDDDAATRANFYQAADARRKAAEEYSVPAEKADSYRSQATNLLYAGDKTGACAALARAQEADPKNPRQDWLDDYVTREGGCK